MRGCCILLSVVIALGLVSTDSYSQNSAVTDFVSAVAGPSFFSAGTQTPGCRKSEMFGSPNLYVGWLEHHKGATWVTNRQGGSTGTAEWPLRGFWLSLSESIMPQDRFGLLLSGSVFFPHRGAGSWYTTGGIGAIDFEVPSYYWWAVDGFVRGGVSDNFDILAGFRWDHTSTRLKYSDNTDDDYVLNLYLPLIGAQLHQQFAGGELLFRIIGTPLVPGRVRYNFWTSTNFSEFGDFDVARGSFVETLLDYRFRMASNLNLGGFVRWNMMHVNTRENSLSGSTTESISWTVDIRSWTVGGSLSLGF
ncbi:hypothetical protein [Desulfomonile tiedjei]|uniref:Protochlamydia outer membrane protein domain-containing protein n=1 Tax=Desulfomonile tiedjei (strain ATCC 49306 / DSM 6799 / DCB-1) TaxID=706587 RepID=I4C7H8_DESTA|nr:hypothetical protein [Desulfomonile tiedjei]AFM25519.1 hypothetical protein Desti_2850 [Desulfomonile tiedjei DSM 6799]